MSYCPLKGRGAEWGQGRGAGLPEPWSAGPTRVGVGGPSGLAPGAGREEGPVFHVVAPPRPRDVGVGAGEPLLGGAWRRGGAAASEVHTGGRPGSPWSGVGACPGRAPPGPLRQGVTCEAPLPPTLAGPRVTTRWGGSHLSSGWRAAIQLPPGPGEADPRDHLPRQEELVQERSSGFCSEPRSEDPVRLPDACAAPRRPPRAGWTTRPHQGEPLCAPSLEAGDFKA